MKNLIVLAFFIGILVYMVQFINPAAPEAIKQNINNYIHPPCSEPITYKIGTVDSKFDVSSFEFKQDVEKAANVWSQALNKNLFKYDPYGKITINMIYDERQSSLATLNSIEDKVITDKSGLSTSKQEYEAKVQSFKQKVADLNAQIKAWNENGGAPEDEYNKLKQKQEELKQEAEQLKSQANQFNEQVSTYNSAVKEFNDASKDLTQVIENKPEEGLYDSEQSTITIFLNVNQNELIHTLTHELGHSLGIEHVDDPTAVMYPYTTKTTTLSAADVVALQEVCKSPYPDFSKIVTFGY